MRDRLLRDTYALLAIAFVGLRLLSVEPWDQSVDAYAYWSTSAGPLYEGGTGAMGAYLYSPAFAQLLAPISWLPWPIFNALWTAVGCALLWWLLGRWSLPALLFLPIPFEIISGNVHLIYAAAIVVAFAHGAAWAVVFITKVTPGVGLLWAIFRRDRRNVVEAIVVTSVVVVASFVVAPDQWTGWVMHLSADSIRPLETVGWYVPVPLIPRVVVAAALCAWGGWTRRPWVVPIAVALALPVVWLNGLSILVAIIPILQAQGRLTQGGIPEAPATRMLRQQGWTR